MKVFKFGGASVRDAESIQNVAKIVSLYKGEKLGIVISAMGKTTNAMEAIVDSLWNKNSVEFHRLIQERRTFHTSIMDALFQDSTNSIYQKIGGEFDALTDMFENRVPDNYDFEYDQIVSIGEGLSTQIVCAYLKQEGFLTHWSDARKLIRTTNRYREAEIDWEKTQSLFEADFISRFKDVDIQITQGFIGHTSEGYTTTLGREGSDFSAGVIAFCCDAQSVTIWKDVPGMLNADPKSFENTKKLDRISFREAIELSYYGASVIHPKTIKPLQNKGISLYVKSFVEPQAEGTIIQASTSSDHLIPSFIIKHDQILFSISPIDFSFLVEKNLSDIFDRLSKANAKINLMQNSALNFSILLDEQKVNTEEILSLFEDSYRVKFNEGLKLITIRHYDQKTIDMLTKDREVLLQQKTRETARFIVKQ